MRGQLRCVTSHPSRPCLQACVPLRRRTRWPASSQLVHRRQRLVTTTGRLHVRCFAQEMSATASDDVLSNFLGWAVSNGTQGIGTSESKLGMYEGENGERGFLATQAIQEGDVLLRVPLKMAFTDFEDDEESNKIMYEGAPWSVRLSAKILRELSRGEASPWWPYLQVLPKSVPSPLEAMTWDEMSEIQYQPGRAALDKYSWLVADSYSRCSVEALGGASEERFQWSMSVVHSRTFGNASPQGGVGVRMLVPLVDMFNHGGDETDSGLLNDATTIPVDNVRWDVVQSDDAWEMVVTATQAVEPGYQLLLCYGARNNDDFFVHYGFVPDANPHESVILFADLEEALDWHYNTFAAEDSSAEPRYKKALDVAQKQQGASIAELLKAAGGSNSLSPTQLDEQKQLVLHAGGRLEAALITAFTMVNPKVDAAAEAAGKVLDMPEDAAVVTGADAAHAEDAVLQRCREMLANMRTSLFQDAALLWSDCVARGDEAGAYQGLALMHHYRQVLCDLDATAKESTNLPIEAFALQLLKSLPTSLGEASMMASPVKLALQYRLGKKMVLWDAIVAISAASTTTAAAISK